MWSREPIVLMTNGESQKKDFRTPTWCVRGGGSPRFAERISNFLLWQMAYSELYFTDVFWPSFAKKDLLKAIRTYQERGRRYGE